MSKASTAQYHRIVEALGELVSDQRVQPVNRLGCLDHLLQTRDKVAEVESSTVAAAWSMPRSGNVTPRYARVWRGLTGTYCQGSRGVW